MGKEITVAGRKVVLRERFPAGEFWDLPRMISELGADAADYESHVQLLVRMVESWDFEGDPSDPDAYAELDILRELRLLIRACSDYVAEMVSGEAT